MKILLDFSVFKSEFNNWQILWLAHCSTEAENLSGSHITYNDDTWGFSIR